MGGWARQLEGAARGTNPSVSYLLSSTYDRSTRVRPYGRGILVYDSNPDESLKRDFQDCAPVTRRNDPARKNLPTNDPKLFAVYKLQSARAEVISPIRPRTSDESRFHLAIDIVNDYYTASVLSIADETQERAEKRIAGEENQLLIKSFRKKRDRERKDVPISSNTRMHFVIFLTRSKNVIFLFLLFRFFFFFIFIFISKVTKYNARGSVKAVELCGKKKSREISAARFFFVSASASAKPRRMTNPIIDSRVQIFSHAYSHAGRR